MWEIPHRIEVVIRYLPRSSVGTGIWITTSILCGVSDIYYRVRLSTLVLDGLLKQSDCFDIWDDVRWSVSWPQRITFHWVVLICRDTKQYQKYQLSYARISTGRSAYTSKYLNTYIKSQSYYLTYWYIRTGLYQDWTLIHSLYTLRLCHSGVPVL